MNKTSLIKKNMAKLNLAVIFGGKSGEHEVSLKSASQVMTALNPEKYNIIPIAITKGGNWLVGEKGKQYMAENLSLAQQEGGVSLEQSQKLVEVAENNNFNFAQGSAGAKIDLVLPIAHGQYVEDGKLQGMLDMLSVPYVFSGTLASALAMNKHKAKLMAKSVGVKIAKEVMVTKGKKYNADKIIAKLNLPIVIKPVELGSSVGINIAKTKEELETGIQKALEYGSEVLLEQFIKGRELTVAVFGNKSPKAFPITEIIPKISGFYDYSAKYQDGGSEHVCPAKVPENIFKKAQKSAVKIFKAIGCVDLARADFIWSESDGKLFFLEINTIPGMTATSLAPEAAKAAGMEFSDFLDKLIGEALKRYK
ncbi:MAG TPA: D-alanine--D-alanine ligase family protein [Patescibacteria group bacterium]|nr:D-alanine--D-alanine ligase family protein [Patescibacteria group bacterium]